VVTRSVQTNGRTSGWTPWKDSLKTCFCGHRLAAKVRKQTCDIIIAIKQLYTHHTYTQSAYYSKHPILPDNYHTEITQQTASVPFPHATGTYKLHAFCRLREYISAQLISIFRRRYPIKLQFFIWFIASEVEILSRKINPANSEVF